MTMDAARNPVVLIAGYTASGKTTLASQLAESLRFAFVDVGSIVRTAALDALARGFDIQDSAAVREYIGQSVFRHYIHDYGLVIAINEKAVDYKDPALRQPFLDTDTLVLAREARESLQAIQRGIAGVTPAVYSVRNGRAFPTGEGVRVFIEPGMTTRIRRRAGNETGTNFFDLTRQQRRDLIARVVLKETVNAANQTAMMPRDIEEEGFTLFRNVLPPQQSLATLKELAVDLLRISYPGYELYREGKLHGRGKEQ